MHSTTQELLNYKAIQSTDQELTIYYNNNTQAGRMTLALAHTLSNHVNKQDLTSAFISTTTIKQLLSKLNMTPKELMNKAHPYYQEAIRGRDFDDNEWMSVLQKNPFLLKAPIVCYKGKAVLCNTPTDIFKVLKS
jgi:arsenate reductase